MKIARIASPRQFCGSLATLALAAMLAACGSGASADSNTLVAAPSARAVQTVASAAPSASAAPAAAPSAAAVAPASSYSGARWQGLPTPGAITPHQEEATRYSIFVAGTQQAVIQLYSAAYLADGWGEASRSTASGSAFFIYVKSGRSVVVAVGPDLGTPSVIVVIDDTL
ncbi:MAG: hypothetical protein U0232_23970 [Thermomicrobiales bacterium]